MLCIEGYYLYGDASDIEWTPADPKPVGYHPGNPVDIYRIYKAHLKSARKNWGTERVLVHRREFVISMRWALRVIQHRNWRRRRWSILGPSSRD